MEKQIFFIDYIDLISPNSPPISKEQSEKYFNELNELSKKIYYKTDGNINDRRS